MWLAARADPAAAGALRRADDAQPYPGTDADPIGDGSGFADVTASLSLSTGAVAGLAPEWSKPGGHVALQMLELGDDDLLDRLAGDWVRWTDPERPYRTVTHCDGQGRRGDGERDAVDAFRLALSRGRRRCRCRRDRGWTGVRRHHHAITHALTQLAS